MISAFLLLQAATVPQITTEPLENERAAAEAFDAHLICLAKEVFARQDDSREIDLLSAQVLAACSQTAVVLNGELQDVYNRKPELRQGGRTSDQAASAYIDVMNASVPVLLREDRERNATRAVSND